MRVEDMTSEHIQEFLSKPIREADAQEWQDGLGGHPRDLLPVVLRPGHYARALSIAGVGCVLLWGCNVDGDMGTLWLVASDYDLSLAPLIHREFSANEWAPIAALAPVLQAYPSSKNTVHHRWLEHFGFKKVRTVTFPGSRVPFLRYVRRRNVL